MLFLTLSNLFFSGLQWIRETVRYQRYAKAMYCLLRRASILVQRANSGQHGNLTRTNNLLNVDRATKGNVVLEDDFIRLSSIQPIQEVDLSSWTSYLDSRHNPPRLEQDICVLLEARRPRDMDSFVAQTLRVAPAYRVHVLTHGCPVAWKTAEPFGIIIHCTLAGLVSLTDAFGQGRLTLDEDLELIGLLTVKTVGTPKTLMLEEEHSEIASLVGGKESVADSTQHQVLATVSGGDTASGGDKVCGGDTASGGDKVCGVPEALDSSSGATSHTGTESRGEQSGSKTDSPLHLDKTFQQKKNSDVDKKSQPKGQSGTSVESPVTGALSLSGTNGRIPNTSRDFTTHDRRDRQSFSKPPNILVYCGLKDTARKFSQVKTSFEACMNTECHALYLLRDEDVLTAPWQHNITLLVISGCARLRPEVSDAFSKFVLNDGGNLLSFNSSIDDSFVEKEEIVDQLSESLVSFRYKNHKPITSVKGRFVYTNRKGNSQILIGCDTLPKSRKVNSLSAHHQADSLDSASSPAREDEKTKTCYGWVVKHRTEQGGTVLFSQLLLERDPMEFASDPSSFATLKQSNALRLEVLRELLSTFGVNTSPREPPTLTTCLLLVQRVGVKEAFLDSFKHRLKNGGMLLSKQLSLKFQASSQKSEPSSSVLPVETDSACDVSTELFSSRMYWDNLRTSKLGQVVFYTDVITSTMHVFDGLLFSIPENLGLIAIAGRQTSGKGRGGNAWLSPVGCAMFTLPLSLRVDSVLGQRVSFLQHMVSVAVVCAVRTLPGYEGLDLRLKWPNDIYYGKEMKLGGVLVTSTVMGSTIYATIGCGFNVSNSNPTLCINDLIHLHNASHSKDAELQVLTPAQLIARTVTILESLLDTFEKKGHEDFCQLYYKYWLHGGTRVKIQLESSSEGEIVGLDEYGFLSVRTPDGKLMSVQPDGNSFDMMHNLIHFKSR